MNSKTRVRSTIVACIVCAITYVASLALPALYFESDADGLTTGRYWGIALLLLGWMEAIGGSSTGVAWFANPLFGLGLLVLLFQRPRWAAACLGLGVAFASASFGIKSVCINEAGHEAPVVGLGPGFWVWYLSIIATLIAAIAISFVPGRSSDPGITLADADFIS